MTNPPVTEEAVERTIRDFKNGDMDAGGTIAALERIARAALTKSPPVTVSDEMVEAGVAEAMDQRHRNYADMCRAIYLAMSAKDNGQ